MMTTKLLKLEWKQFFRSSSFGKNIAIKFFMGLLALYFIVCFLAIGFGGFYILKEKYPEQNPFDIVNSYLLMMLFADFIFRYLMQKLPILNIKPLLILPIKKNKLVRHVLFKSIFSYFNIISLFFYIPFSIVLLKNNYNTTGVLSWLTSIILLSLCLNFANFLINKSTKAFTILALTLVTTGILNYFEIIDINQISLIIFEKLYTIQLLILIPLILLITLYLLNYKNLCKQLFIEIQTSEKKNIVNSSNLSFVEVLGDLAPFVKNEIRQIWRNKRTKTVAITSCLFLLYGLLFFTQENYRNLPVMLIFAALFITGGFAINYGQFIPAWESSYYKTLMTQSFRYRKFLESKWLLLVIMTFVLYLLSIPYIYFGTKIFLIITVTAVYNIGFNSLFLLWAGSFNKKRIDLNASGFGNYQGTSATQFLIVIPIMGIPMLTFWITNNLFNFNIAVILIALIGVLGIIFKNFFMNIIEKQYIKNKYKTIHGFNEKN